MKKCRGIIGFVAFALMLTSCEKILYAPDKGTSDPHKNFEYLWDQVDKKYSYFELKQVNWQQIKENYSVQISSDMSEEELFSVLASMLNELRDDHTNLVAPFNVSVYSQPQQAVLNYHSTTVWENYVTDRYYTGAFSHGFIDGKNIGYVRYSSFMSSFSSSQLDFVLDRYKNTAGLVLDLRENGGGSIFNVPLLLERFNDQSRVVGFFRTRNGVNHTDFSEPSNFMVNTHSGVVFHKPVIVLIDKGSYSATTMFALATKAIPNIILVGDSTGGGGGLPNGGQLPNGWTYRFSISQLLDLNGNSYAEDGVPPDIHQLFDWNDLTTDEILERAITELE